MRCIISKRKTDFSLLKFIIFSTPTYLINMISTVCNTLITSVSYVSLLTDTFTSTPLLYLLWLTSQIIASRLTNIIYVIGLGLIFPWSAPHADTLMNLLIFSLQIPNLSFSLVEWSQQKLLICYPLSVMCSMVVYGFFRVFALPPLLRIVMMSTFSSSTVSVVHALITLGVFSEWILLVGQTFNAFTRYPKILF